jgi:hypothetical protein
MNSSRAYLVASLLVSALATASGCSDGDGSGSGPGSEAEQRMTACPVTSVTSDVTASACLTGAFNGTTLSGGACSLTVGAAGAYEFTSPTLTISYTPSARTIFVFGHNLVQGFHQIEWRVADPIMSGIAHELDFSARFGDNVPNNDAKIEIEGTTRAADGGSTSVACIVSL